MSSFKFPPPPPPPPKAASNDIHANQRDGFTRGRGDRNNDRGGRGRGGNSNFGGIPRGGHSQGNARGRGRGHQNSNGPGHGRGGSHSGYGQQQYGRTTPQINHSSAAQPHVDPNALVQAMSFMATPAGAQTMAAFASHMATTGAFSGGPGTQSLPTHYAQSPPQQSQPHHAGQKRKWEDRNHNNQTRPPPQPKPQQQGSKPPRAKAAVAPPVPSFGFSLPTTSFATASKPSNLNTKHDSRKGKVRLGLTNQQPPDESSEEDDSDEEGALAAKIKGGGYAFEHNGEHISLQTAADIAAWIKDRRTQFPTQQKILEKAEAAAAKRTHELEFIRKLRGKPPRLENSEKAQPKPTLKSQARSKQEEKKQQELAALRKKLHESMMKKKETPAAVDLGLGYGSETDSGGESSELSESSVVSSSEEWSDESDDSEAAPEASSSKIAPPPINVPPPAPLRSQRERQPDKERICQKFKQYGKCPFGKSCKFQHSTSEAKRPSLYEKLVEQELLKSDQLALDAIKYLGQNGFLG